ncbi:MAG: S1 RNA-binding domain-containing protein [Actinomycetota bacterium]
MPKTGPKHVVVDGSNVATEGRTSPSLKQLNEAVLSFMKEFPSCKITVVVDATFGHRIDKRETSEFNSAINNNELVAPPAGAVGRGDGFVLTIAEKIGASILSNDSYQEFHEQYPWLFNSGRLIGGKPVPNVGWVFIERLPVRPSATKSVKKASREANRPMPVPKAPPPASKLPAPKQNTQVAKQNAPAAKTPAPKLSAKPKAATINELSPFLEFVEKYPVGSKVKGVVDQYSAHGVYVKIGDVRGYLPLRLMATPAPRSAREHVKIGQQVNLSVDSFVASRRSIDVAIVGTVTPMKKAPAPAATPTKAKKKKKRPQQQPVRQPAPTRKAAAKKK